MRPLRVERVFRDEENHIDEVFYARVRDAFATAASVTHTKLHRVSALEKKRRVSFGEYPGEQPIGPLRFCKFSYSSLATSLRLEFFHERGDLT